MTVSLMKVSFVLSLQTSWKSVRSRKTIFVSGVVMVALSVALIFWVEQLRKGAELGFSGSISQVDLVVGARSSPMQLVLYSIFNLGGATNNISWSNYEKYKNHPAVEWTIPFSLGDGYRGFRVVGTNQSFYEHYRVHGHRSLEFASGQSPQKMNEVVLGHRVAKALDYQVGSEVVIVHGDSRGQGFIKHDDRPFKVVGVLRPTGTAIDFSLYIDLAGFEALHLGWDSGVAPTEALSWDQVEGQEQELIPESITSFLVRTKSRIESLRLQREINQNQDEALTAAMPGVVLSELWQLVGFGQNALKIISVIVTGVSLLGVWVFLYLAFETRLREISVLRSLGATKSFVVKLFVLDGFYIVFLGAILGLLLGCIGFFGFQWVAASYFNLLILWSWPSAVFLGSCGILIVSGVLLSFVPASRAFSKSVKAGLHG